MDLRGGVLQQRPTRQSDNDKLATRRTLSCPSHPRKRHNWRASLWHRKL